MATFAIVRDATTGGMNTNVIRVISQTTETSAAPFTMSANRGYILTRNTIQDVFFPATPLVGDIYYLQGKGTGLFRLEQFGTQQVLFGDKETIAGFAGYIESTNKNDSMFLICIVAAGTASVFSVMPGAQGNFNMSTAGGIVSQNSVNNSVNNSTTREYGEIYIEPDANASMAIGNTWKRWTGGTFSAGPLSNFVWDDPTNSMRLIYTGAGEVFNLRLNMTSDDPSATLYKGAIYVNGVSVDKSIFHFENVVGSSMSSSGYAKIPLSTNDFIEPYVRAIPANALTLQALTLDANQA